MADEPPILPVQTSGQHAPELTPTAAPVVLAQPVARGPRPRSRRLRRFALGTAVVVDTIQIVLLPLFSPGFASPATMVVDVTAFLLFWRLLGWHLLFLPAFITEQLPLADLAPSWTLAVWLVSRKQRLAEDTEAPN